MNKTLHNFINSCVGLLGVRFVNTHWGPRGFADTFRRIQAQGLVLNQIVDVGASDGCWTRECMRVFPQAKYFLVEPRLEHRGDLESFVRVDSRVAWWHGALGSHETTMPLILHGGQSSFLPSKTFRGERVNISVRRLDDLVCEGRLTPPDLIKADVQGYELEVLKGAEECLQSCKLLLLEVSFRRIYDNCPLAHEVIAYVGQRGYRLFDICTYSQRPYDQELGQSDLLFANAESGLFNYEEWS